MMSSDLHTALLAQKVPSELASTFDKNDNAVFVFSSLTERFRYLRKHGVPAQKAIAVARAVRARPERDVTLVSTEIASIDDEFSRTEVLLILVVGPLAGLGLYTLLKLAISTLASL